MMPKGDSSAASPNAKLLTEIVLLVFRVNGRLLSAGDRLVGDLGLTSARWQMLGGWRCRIVPERRRSWQPAWARRARPPKNNWIS